MPIAPDRSIPILIKTTEVLIECEPTAIRLLHAPELEDNGRGGKKRQGVGVLESAPVNRFFSQTTPRETVTIKSEGKDLIIDWVLIGLPGDDIRAGDEFTVDGYVYKVWEVHPDTRWQVKGLCKRSHK